MNPTLQPILVNSVICFALICSLIRFKVLDKPSRLLVLLLILAQATEITATFFTKRYNNNMPVYNIYSIVELIIITQYFSSIKLFRNKNTGHAFSVVILVVGILNFILLQPITAFNTYFLLFEGFLVIAFSLYTFYKILLYNDDMHLVEYVHFWFVTYLLFFWILTYMYWGLYEVMELEIRKYMWLPNLALVIANVIMYCGIGITFIFYKRMKTVNE